MALFGRKKSEREPKPGDPKLREPKPQEPKPAEPKLAEPKPGEPEPAEPKPGELRVGTFNNAEELVTALHGYVAPVKALAERVAEGAPPVLPGLVLTAALPTDGRIDFLPHFSVAQLTGNPEDVWDFLRVKLRSLDGIQVVREAVTEGSESFDTVTLMHDEDPFVASRCAVLDWLVQHLYGTPSHHGVLVAVPSRHVLMLHLISGASAIEAAKTFALVASHMYETCGTASQLTPDVFLVAPDNRTHRAAYIEDMKNLVIDLSGLFGEVLFSEPPTGLGLPPSSWPSPMGPATSS